MQDPLNAEQREDTQRASTTAMSAGTTTSFSTLLAERFGSFYRDAGDRMDRMRNHSCVKRCTSFVTSFLQRARPGDPSPASAQKVEAFELQNV